MSHDTQKCWKKDEDPRSRPLSHYSKCDWLDEFNYRLLALLLQLICGSPRLLSCEGGKRIRSFETHGENTKLWLKNDTSKDRTPLEII